MSLQHVGGTTSERIPRHDIGQDPGLGPHGFLRRELRIFLKEASEFYIIASHPIYARPAFAPSARLQSHTSPHTKHNTMLQRTILRASRQASRTSAFAPLRQSLVSTRVATAPAIRWYSDAPAAPAAKEGESAEKKEDAPNDEAAKLKTDIEKKDKEIVELKVCFLAP
jgi:hypothetical protein